MREPRRGCAFGCVLIPIRAIAAGARSRPSRCVIKKSRVLSQYCRFRIIYFFEKAFRFKRRSLCCAAMEEMCEYGHAVRRCFWMKSRADFLCKKTPLFSIHCACTFSCSGGATDPTAVQARHGRRILPKTASAEELFFFKRHGAEKGTILSQCCDAKNSFHIRFALHYV